MTYWLVVLTNGAIKNGCQWEIPPLPDNQYRQEAILATGAILGQPPGAWSVTLRLQYLLHTLLFARCMSALSVAQHRAQLVVVTPARTTLSLTTNRSPRCL